MSASQKPSGKLYLIPVPLVEGLVVSLPAYWQPLVHQLDYFVVERAKTARHFLRGIDYPGPLQEVQMAELNEHSKASDIPSLLQPLLEGRSAGLLSEAGCPGVADPGAQLVAAAHQHGVEVIPLVGPSSLLLALMASGMNGQRFAFQGYLPARKPELMQTLRRLEQQVVKHNETQLFIETPYRNMPTLETLFQSLSPDVKLCIAVDLTAPTQWIATKRIAEWRREKLPDLHKRPAVFVLGR